MAYGTVRLTDEDRAARQARLDTWAGQAMSAMISHHYADDTDVISEHVTLAWVYANDMEKARERFNR